MTSVPRFGIRQVRYFLAAAEELNFTRAASRCNISQPTLTRAISRLEEEMGGDLFRRERNLTHLTDLGSRIKPLLERVMENVDYASSVAKSIQTQESVKLHIGISQPVPLRPIAPHLQTLTETFQDFDFKVARGDQADLIELLKIGELDIVFGYAPDETWNRFELKKLFRCDFKLIFRNDHSLAEKAEIRIEDLKGMSLLHRPYCPISKEMRNNLADNDVTLQPAPEFACDGDMLTYLSSSKSLGYLPTNRDLSSNLIHRELVGPRQGFDLHAITVAGRRRGPALSRLLKEIGGADWPTNLAA